MVSTVGAAALADLLFGEPPADLHPTVWMGRGIELGKGATSWWRRGAGREFLAGGLLLGIGGALVGISGAGLGDLLGRVPGTIGQVMKGIALKPALSLRALLEAGAEVECALRGGDLSAARVSLGWHLVSRETADLTASGVASAAIESLAENLADGFVAPLIAHRVGGLGAAYLLRFINTADAMLGYRTPELEWFGKAAARMDDVVNFIPARLTGFLLALSAPIVRGSTLEALRVMRREADRMSSPNSGWPIAAVAGALGVRLEKEGEYQINEGGIEPGPNELTRARRLIMAAALSALPILSGECGGRRAGRGRR